jgi:hypothetical protein
MTASTPNESASPEATIASALERLERRLGRIEGTLDRTTAAAARGPDLAATVGRRFR